MTSDFLASGGDGANRPGSSAARLGRDDERDHPRREAETLRNAAARSIPATCSAEEAPARVPGKRPVRCVKDGAREVEVPD